MAPSRRSVYRFHTETLLFLWQLYSHLPGKYNQAGVIRPCLFFVSVFFIVQDCPRVLTLYAGFTVLATRFPPWTLISIFSPSPTLPLRIRRAARVSTFFWINRFSGRAP